VGEHTAISWTDHTFNPWWGCERVSPGCQHCYAEAFAKRTGNHVWGKQADRRFFGDKHWAEPPKWNAAAELAGRPALVFCASMADVFEDRPDLEHERERLFDLIARTPHLIWQLLTKRPQNITRMVPTEWVTDVDIGTLDEPELRLPSQWPANVWIGTTVEDQQRARERIPRLLEVPAPVRFLSCEPLLGLVDLNPWLARVDRCPRCNGSMSVPVPGGGQACPDCFDDPSGQGNRTTPLIHWVIVGGESGPRHRPLELQHARYIVNTCHDWKVPVLFKQIGGRTPTAGGHLLDGRAHHQFPEEAKR